MCPPKSKPSTRENGFDLIYREENWQTGVPAVNLRRPFSVDLCYPIADMKPFIGKMYSFKQKKSFQAQIFLKKTPKIEEPAPETPQKADTPKSHSLVPNKAHSFRTKGSESSSQERKPTRRFSSTHKSTDKKPKAQLAKGPPNDTINEEEDNLPSDDSDVEEAKKIVQVHRKNLLCKTLLDQCKELCYQQSLVYKDFDTIFFKIISRMQHWNLMEDDDITMAGQSLRMIANSGQLVNLVQDVNISKIFNLYDQEEMHTMCRKTIAETFLAIAKNIGLRKIFLRK